jgi:2',3'-cyclic-nucleotide 2'-phosphodiesterase (5'-nucleotidase family)
MSELNGNTGLNQHYERINPHDKNYIYIPIVGTDDIHGTFFPRVNNIKIGNKTLTYKTGGLEYIAKYINIIREEFGSNRVLYLDAGDFFQGGIESVLFDGEIMLDYFNLIGLNGSTIGNHEFDYSREWIESKIKKGKYKTLINNIMDNSSHKKYGALGENQEKSHLYEVNLNNGDTIKIGVIGLSFNMKNDKQLPNTWGNRDTWDNITFFSYMTELISESKKLREEGANAILILSHFGLVCNQTEAMKLDMYNKSTIQGECFRDDEDSVLYKLLDNLPPGIIDGIIGGDTHMEMHHWEKNIPMMSVPKNSRYLNIMYLPFLKGNDGKYSLVNEQIKIEGPLPACEKIFKNSKNCELISSNEFEQVGELISYSWHGIKIETDEIVKPIYDKYYERFKEYAEQKIVTFKGFNKIKVDKSGDCILCNTYLDAIVEIKEADFAIINRGIFPEELVPSTLTRRDFYNQMPYLDKICTVDIKGEELKKIVSTVQSIGKAFYPSSNLKQTIKVDNLGNKEVINIELYKDGELTQIEDDKIYKMASSMFVLSENSGEDFAKGESFHIIHEKAINNKIECSKKTIDKEMSDFFKGRGTIDLSDKIDPERPRIIILQ